MNSNEPQKPQLNIADVISGYSMTKLDRPLEILTHNELRLIGVTEIGINPHLGILYIIGERKYFEKESSYTILNRL